MAKEVKGKREEFKLPKYLRLDKGSMWFDLDGEMASGIKLYAVQNILVGRTPGSKEIVKDEFDNNNLLNYGKIPSNLPWYIDTTKIPNEKLSRILLAFKNGILVETNIENPPKPFVNKDDRDFKYIKDGDRIFNGKNKEIYVRLQQLNFDRLRNFINETPKNETGRQNLMDMFEYEKKGYNPLSRPRFEVLELIRSKLREFGNGISVIRKNED